MTTQDSSRSPGSDSSPRSGKAASSKGKTSSTGPENPAPANPAALDVAQVTAEYFPRIHRAALVLTGNPWDADDLAQETFLVLSGRVVSFEGRSSIYTWLYGVLLNLDRRERRRHGMRRKKLQVLWDDEPTGGRTMPPAETPIEVAEWKTSLWARVAQLPDGQRQTLVLRFSEGLRYEEIAAALECPLGTVKSRIYHGLIGLRSLLEKEGDTLTQLPSMPAEDRNYAV
ncbi:RNA polymerase sigma factor [Lignipirellula cremea]|uniref:ECF RNA polymerase sigma factor SigW n=1 Tax=Lignipirellula cremea TaxID=2528010 RepID=A0A518DPW6_9BACT|nr:RNA polymerase sigma factor [Lignipirellula cremea]QDU93879.1 ECF RNA polymerase sigma factor SigW [Lignipirellula cremea]